MQYSSYVSQSKHLLPIFSAAENCGFEDARSANTKLRKPRWQYGRKLDVEIEPTILRNGIKAQFLIRVDRATWAGDSDTLSQLRSLIRSFRIR